MLNEGLDFFLRLVSEDQDMLKGIFRDPLGILRDRMPIFPLDSWSEEKKAVLDRLVRRGLAKLEHRHPVEPDFPFWLLVRKSAPTDKNLAELQEEYLQTETVPVLFLTDDGRKFLEG